MWQQHQGRNAWSKSSKFCSKFPQHLFSLTFQLSQPCYVSPFINVYEVVAITAAIKQTKIANECLSFSICLYYPGPPPIQHPHIAYRHPPSRKSWPHPESSAVRLLYCCILWHLLLPWWASVSKLLPSRLWLLSFCLSLCPLLVSLMPHFLAFWLFWPQYLGPISLFRVPRPSLT